VDDGRVDQIFLRELGEKEAVPLAGTEGGTSPFFSPDGKWIGFRDDTEEKLERVSVDGGTPVVIVDDVWGRGSTWGPDDFVVFTKKYSTGLWRVPAAGGTPEMLTEPDAAVELGHFWPQILPGGREVLFTSYRSSPELTRLMVHSLETGQQRTVFEGAYFGRYVPTGHLLYLKKEILFAIRFDLESLATTGTGLPVLEDVGGLFQWLGHLGVSENGTLAYIPHSTQYPPKDLVWVDRGGSEERLEVESRPFVSPTLSPDGRRIAVSIMADDTEVWIYELSRGISTPLTHQPTSDEKPIWTHDGRRVIYSRENIQFDIYWIAADGRGQEELLHSSDYDLFPLDVSPDGKWLFFQEDHASEDLWLLPLDGEGEATPFLRTPFDERSASFSPDGHWVAYDSDESGQPEVYIQEFPGASDKYRVSIDGGSEPCWSRDGTELYFLSGQKMMAATVRLGADIEIDKPQILFEGSYDDYWIAGNFDVAPDGRFLMVKTPPENASRQVNVVLDWFGELERLVPPK
jgi:serine/threonine-protein kinase